MILIDKLKKKILQKLYSGPDFLILDDVYKRDDWKRDQRSTWGSMVGSFIAWIPYDSRAIGESIAESSSRTSQECTVVTLKVTSIACKCVWVCGVVAWRIACYNERPIGTCMQPVRSPGYRYVREHEYAYRNRLLKTEGYYNERRPTRNSVLFLARPVRARSVLVTVSSRPIW